MNFAHAKLDASPASDRAHKAPVLQRTRETQDSGLGYLFKLPGLAAMSAFTF